MSTPTPAEIAHRDARRLATVLREVGGESAPVGSGWMACDLPGSWADYAAGLGEQGPVDEATLNTLVSFYRARGRQPKIQTTPYQHPSLVRGLTQRGFVPHDRETVLFFMLETLPEASLPSGLHFRQIDPACDEDVTTFRNSQMVGFYGEEPPPAGMLPITDRVVQHPRSSLWVLELHGAVVGGGGLEFYEDTALLIGGCVHEKARRQGLHSAFLRFRLEQAARAGQRYAIVASLEGGPTERNALRTGFKVAYTTTDFRQP